MIEFDVVARVSRTIHIKRIDEDFFPGEQGVYIESTILALKGVRKQFIPVYTFLVGISPSIGRGKVL